MNAETVNMVALVAVAALAFSTGGLLGLLVAHLAWRKRFALWRRLDAGHNSKLWQE